MPLTSSTHDSLPYIDAPPSPRALNAARALIISSLSSTQTQTLHPSLPALPPSSLTPLLTSEQDRIAASTPLTGISTERYEAPASSSSSSSSSSPDPSALRAAYTASTYLSHRNQNLSLQAQEFGKNAWLVHNSQLEDILRAVEKEVVEAREQVEGVNRERKGMQEARRVDVEGLGQRWREGVRAVVECQVAVEELGKEISGSGGGSGG
ncbi:MAG: hypothetical protein Q9191_000310 [Dirinaria sp. TL-2023a]